MALAGLPATGKSTLAKALGPALDALVLDKDVLRAALFADRVDYSAEQNDLVIDIAYRTAAYLHRTLDRPTVIIDGRTFSERHQVVTLKRAASAMQTSLVIIECRCTPDTARQRLSSDDGSHPAADRDFALYLRRRASADPIEEPKLVLDTDRMDLRRCLALSIEYARARLPGSAAS